MRQCLFCQQEYPGDEDGVYVCRGTEADARWGDDEVAHVGCLVLMLVQEPEEWYWYAFAPHADDPADSAAKFWAEIALLRSLT